MLLESLCHHQPSWCPGDALNFTLEAPSYPNETALGPGRWSVGESRDMLRQAVRSGGLEGQVQDCMQGGEAEVSPAPTTLGVM